MSTQFTNRQWRLPNNENKDKQSNYSMDFDGSSLIDLGDITMLNGVSQASYSFWFKLSSYTPVSGSSSVMLVGSNAKGASCYIYLNNFYIHNFNTKYIYFGVPSLNQWHHVCCVFNSGVAVAYLDGVSVGTVTEPTLTTTASDFGDNYNIGYSSFYSAYMNANGQIDGLSFFNYALSSSQITTLYGSSSTGIGNPMSLSTKPVAFYNLGDKSAFNGANYLVPNIAAQEDDGDIATSYSPYALDFDGTNDYIALPTITLTDNWSVSVWMNQTTLKQRAQAVGTTLTTPTNNFWNYGAQVPPGGGDAGKLIYYNYSTQQYTPLSNNRLDDGNWHNWIITYDHSATTLKCYIDGQENYSDTYNTGTGNTINRISNSYASNYWLGQLSNISIWNTALTSAQVTEIYSEGVPSNLNNHSAYSNLVSWWQLGSNSSFNTNWTVLDEKGSNNGTSSNMDEVDIVDGVGSYANGVSVAMSDNIVGDAPYSTANSLSVNMDVLDRVTDTPS